MSLVKKPEMTEANLAAHRSNGSMSQGAVTPEGRARAASANLRHGFYCQAPNGALPALGEDPQDYADLISSMESDLEDGLETQLVQLIGDTVWRLRRARRMKNAQAMHQVKSAIQVQKTITNPQMVRMHETMQCYENMADALRRRGDGPTTEEIQSFAEEFRDSEAGGMQELIHLLKSLKKLPEGPERKAASRRARAKVNKLMEIYRRSCEHLSDQFDEIESPENLLAVAAPRDDRSMLMQRVEDSSLRQLWRLSDVLMKVRNGAFTPRSIKNEGCSGDVYENKEKAGKINEIQGDILSERPEILP